MILFILNIYVLDFRFKGTNYNININHISQFFNALSAIKKTNPTVVSKELVLFTFPVRKVLLLTAIHPNFS